MSRLSGPAGQLPAPAGGVRAVPRHRLICRRCERTEDGFGVLGVTPCPEPAAAGGFAIDEAEVVFRGLCPDCAGIDSGRR